jgi:hypothetical protein
MAKSSKDGLRQTAIWLPEAMIERLQRIAGPRGMAGEIRRRLEASFEAERAQSDPMTKALLADIARASDMLAAYRAWQNDRWVYVALEAAIGVILAQRRPPETKPKPQLPPGAARDLLGDQKPEDVGRVVAAMVLKGSAALTGPIPG